MSLIIGTSGWSYKEWIGPFYEKKTGMFSHYKKYFNTTEINSTFYRYPSEGMIMGLLRNSPPGFVFSAKLPKLITHDKWLNPDNGIEADTHKFLGLMRPLAEHLGPILIQLRPKFNYTEHMGDLETFLDMVPKNYEWAIEFRHESWLRKETFELLRKYNVAYTVVDEPLLPPEVHMTADFSYVRWHGHGSQLWYDYDYSKDQLEGWVPKVKEITNQVRRTYGYFNNHFNANAVKNAVEMLELLGEANPQQMIAYEKIISHREEVERPFGVQTLDAFRVTEEDLSVADHLLHFTDPARIHRGEKIKNNEIVISLREDDHLMGDIRDYYIDVDVNRKVIRHNCDDWRKGKGSKRFCKHLVSFFLSLPPGQATRILSIIWDNVDGWSFED